MLKNWFLIALVTVLATGFFGMDLAPESAAWLAEQETIKWTIVTLTMFLMAWPLSFENLKQAGTKPTPTIIACLMNCVFIPLITWPLFFLCGRELGFGLAIAAATPTTLATGAVFVRRAGGNDAVAMLATLITNGTCFLIMPFWIWVMLSSELSTGSDAIDQTALLSDSITKLLCFVVLPIFVAQAFRLPGKLGQWATDHKPMLGRWALVGVLSMVLVGAIKMRQRFDSQTGEALSPTDLLITATLVITIHLMAFVVGNYFAKMARLPMADRIAVAISGSQKTLVIGLSMAIGLGVSIIPLLMYHTFQLLIDSVIVEKFRAAAESANTDDAVQPSAEAAV